MWFVLIAMFLILFAVKVSGNRNISWWWVTAPLWAPFALTFLWIAILVVFAALAGF